MLEEVALEDQLEVLGFSVFLLGLELGTPLRLFDGLDRETLLIMALRNGLAQSFPHFA